MKADEQAYQAGLNQIQPGMKYDGIERVQLLRRIVAQMRTAHPQMQVVRVCGTNGKGSTISMVNQICLAAHVSTVMFTSPYLIDPLTQIQLNGQPISKAQFLAAERAVQSAVASLGYSMQTDVSEFESWFLIAVQVAIENHSVMLLLECGMGGELDATNGIDHSDFSLFTLIGLDHFKFLGDTLEQIATTKVRMIRDDETVIDYPAQRPATDRILKQVAQERSAHLIDSAKVKIDLVAFDENQLVTRCTWNGPAGAVGLKLRLLGDYQLQNVRTVLAWWQAYNARAKTPISVAALQQGIANTEIVGRFSRLANGWVVDGAHNRDAINAFVAATQEYFADQPKVIMVGFLADKEVERCVHELQRLRNVLFVTVTPDNHDRTLPADQLARLFEAEPRAQSGVNRVVNANTIAAGVQFLKQHQPTQCLVVGSFYTVKGTLSALQNGGNQSED